MSREAILTDGEIDALTDSVPDSPGDGVGRDGRGYRPFDFTAREQAVLDQFTALRPIGERQAESLAEQMERMFGVGVEVTAHTPQLLRYDEVLAGMAAVASTATVEIEPLAGNCHVICPAELLCWLVNQYFGGGNSGAPKLSGRSTLTPSELRLSELVVEQVLQAMQSAWADKLPLHPAEIAVDSYPDRLASRPAADLALRISFDVSVEDWSAPLQLILPFASLEPYKERFRPPRRRVEDDAHASEWEAHLRRELLNVPVEISGVLATQEISLKRLLQLRAGSVLELQKPGRVAVCAGGEPVGMGDYGAYQGKKAIKVLGMALSVERRNDS